MLLFAAGKLLLSNFIDITPGVSLAVIAGILIVTVAASRLFPGKRAYSGPA